MQQKLQAKIRKSMAKIRKFKGKNHLKNGKNKQNLKGKFTLKNQDFDRKKWHKKTLKFLT